MNKIYLVEWFGAGPYSDYSGPLKAFRTIEAAREFISNTKEVSGEGPYEKDDSSFGWYLHSDPVEVEFVDE